jgi:NAD(P)-dependent dehydrogenase (short-subunit alcohol dehydrogenase family)
MLADNGSHIVAVDVEDTDSIREDLQSFDNDVHTVTCDVSNEADCERLGKRLDAIDRQVNILVHAAGIIEPGRDVSFEDVTLEEWNRVLDVNLTGAFLVTRVVYDRLRAARYGKLVYIGSMAGVRGSWRSGPNYAASKGGLHAFAKWVAKRGAEHGIYANVIAPGPVRTSMTADEEEYSDSLTPLGRLGTPEDVAYGVLFFASEMSNYVTGTVFNMNGGIFMR